MVKAVVLDKHNRNVLVADVQPLKLRLGYRRDHKQAPATGVLLVSYPDDWRRNFVVHCARQKNLSILVRAEAGTISCFFSLDRLTPKQVAPLIDQPLTALLAPQVQYVRFASSADFCPEDLAVLNRYRAASRSIQLFLADPQTLHQTDEFEDDSIAFIGQCTFVDGPVDVLAI